MNKLQKLKSNNILIVLSRFFGILSRYAFILILGKVLDKDEFSDFNLISSLVIYIIFFAGLDYYNHLHRNYYNNRSLFLKYLNNYFFLLFISVTFGNFFGLFFLKQFDNYQIVLIFVVIISFTELFLQETYRFEILKGKILNANIFAFLRYIWMLLYIFSQYFLNFKLNFIILLEFWAITNLLISTLIFLLYYNFRDKISIKKINFQEIIISLKIIFPLFLSTLIFRSFFLLDRWLPQFLNVNKSEISTYSLLALAGSGFTIFIDTIYINFYYPLLMKYKETDDTLYKQTIKIFFKKLLKISISIILLFSIFFLFIKKINYGRYVFKSNLIILTLLSQVFYNLSLIPNLVLFSIKKDKSILYTNLISLIFFILLIIIFHFCFHKLSALVVLLSLSLSFALLFFMKSFIIKKYGYKIY